MHTMKFGPRILITNTRRQEDLMCKKLETHEMPPVILADKTASELEVEKWYRDHQQVRNVVLEFAKRHPTGKVAKLARSLDLNAYREVYPAPPVIMEVKK